MNGTYTVIRSSRRTIGLEIRDGRLIVRAPRSASQREIDRVLSEKRAWILKHLEASRIRAEKAAAVPPLTPAELHALAEEALRVIPERVRHYAGLLGVRPTGITIRNQRTRWGSCSSKGRLNFNCLLMLTPPEVLDSVVVHELCHLKEMNHSAAFYREVYRIFPEYDRWHGWLREHQTELLARLGSSADAAGDPPRPFPCP